MINLYLASTNGAINFKDKLINVKNSLLKVIKKFCSETY